MNGNSFVDTNLLVYCRDSSEAAKNPVAMEWLSQLWKQGNGRISFQVLHEYYVVVTRKLSGKLPVAIARRDVLNLLAWRPVPTSRQLMENAWQIEDRYGLSWWDALVVSAAKIAGCRYLLTEDLQAGQDLGGLIVIDPFQTAPAEIFRNK